MYNIISTTISNSNFAIEVVIGLFKAFLVSEQSSYL